MANKFQNGLYLTSTDGNNVGQVLARWIVEWCVQVIGMTLYDSAATSGSWTATIATGADGASVVGDVTKFSAVGRTWTTADIGRYITITGMTDPSKDGIYRIANIVIGDAGKVILDTKYSVHEDGIPTLQSGLTWRLWDGTSSYRPAAASGNWAILEGTYLDATKFHLAISTNTTSARMPSVAIGPWATWNSGTHAWSDSRNTAARVVANWDHGGAVSIFACGDKHRVVFGFYSRSTTNYGFMYLGEITPAYSASDPKPAITMSGGENDGSYMLGNGCSTGSDTVYSGGRMMAYAGGSNNVSVSGFFNFPCTFVNEGTNRLKGLARRWSQWSRKMYRLEILVSCNTSTYMEMRGVLKDLWATGQDYPKLLPFGSSREYLHWGYGMAFTWNGSKVHVQK